MRKNFFTLSLLFSFSILITSLLIATSPLIAEPTIGEYSERNLTKKQQRRKRARMARKRLEKRGGLRILPASGEAIRSKRKNANRIAYSADGRIVSGEPPRLVDIASDPANIFWQSGHVAAIGTGTATLDQCNSFWGGISDGESAGFGACNMAEGLGRALELAAEGGISLCYMKSFPSEENLQAGGLSVISGSLPENDITKIFSPGDSPRIVQVDITGFPSFGEEQEPDHSIFIRVSPESDSFFYKSELWFCDGTSVDSQVAGTDVIEIAKSGRITSRNENTGPGGEVYYSEFVGFLRPGKGGLLQYDKDRSRTAQAGFASNLDSFKVAMTLKGQQVELQTRAAGGGGEPFMNSAIMRFSGDAPEEVRFLDGAFRSIFNGDDGLEGTAEWRDSYYAAVPQSSLIEKIQSEEEMNNDPFFQSGPETNFDFSPYSCGVTPDIHVALDFSNQTLLASVADCQPDTFRNLNFCFGNMAINLAQQEFENSCSGGI